MQRVVLVVHEREFTVQIPAYIAALVGDAERFRPRAQGPDVALVTQNLVVKKATSAQTDAQASCKYSFTH